MSEDLKQALSILTTSRAGADQVCEAGRWLGGTFSVCALNSAYLSGIQGMDPALLPYPRLWGQTALGIKTSFF